MKKYLSKSTLIKALIVAVGLAFVLNLPYLTSDYMLRVLNMAMITYICVLSIYVLFGLCGQHSFGQAGLWGVGAYITAIMVTRFQYPPIVAVLLAMAGTALFAFVLGLALFRLRKYYFTFSTVGMMMILYSLFLNWTPVTGGAMGIANIPGFSIGGFTVNTEIANYYFIFAVIIATTFVVVLLSRSRLGRSFMAICDNETASKCMGINSMLTKNIAFAISGALCGLAGALFAFLAGFISSASFTYQQSTMYLVMIMLGGTASPIGGAFGSVVLTLLPEWFRPLQDYMMLIYGVGIMALMIFMPDGIIGGGKALYAKFIDKRKKTRADA